VVPPGFKCDLIYTVPDIEVPCVLACGDEGSLYVGEDPMDMTGPPTKEIDRVVKIRWDKATGRPIKTVFAENLAAVFGLIWHDGALYVMHAPHYTMLKDTRGAGVADVRKDLAEGFGAPAGFYGFNDHIVSSIHLGMDGLVYVSCGDKGIPKAVGAHGSELTLEGGGVVRMRLDGTQLENFSSGTRNHLGLSLDWLDNIFTYDNTDDGLGWWTRFTHHIETGYYGYPSNASPAATGRNAASCSFSPRFRR
jgi:glucose/arabinose dehydrogenase